MGYIMPVVPYEYMQYTNRTVESNKNPFNPVKAFLPIHPIKFRRQSEEEAYHEEEKEQAQTPFSLHFKRKEEIAPEIVAKMAAKVTGKGIFVNQYI